MLYKSSAIIMLSFLFLSSCQYSGKEKDTISRITSANPVNINQSIIDLEKTKTKFRQELNSNGDSKLMALLKVSPSLLDSESQFKHRIDLSEKKITETFDGPSFIPEGPAGTEANIPPGMREIVEHHSGYTKVMEVGNYRTKDIEGGKQGKTLRYKYQSGSKKSKEKRIRNAYITLEIQDYKSWHPKLVDLVRVSGGYLSNSNLYIAKNNYKHGTIIIRMPKDRFDGTLEQIKGLGKLLSEKIDTLDVTEEYIDLETRLKNKQITEARLKELMKKKVSKLSELLEVERELQSITEEVDRLKGKLNYIEDKVNYSTLTLTFRETEEKRAEGSAFWKGFFDSTGNAFKTGFSSSLNLILSILEILIAGIPVWVGVYFGWKLLKRYLKKRKVSSA